MVYKIKFSDRQGPISETLIEYRQLKKHKNLARLQSFYRNDPRRARVVKRYLFVTEGINFSFSNYVGKHCCRER